MKNYHTQYECVDDIVYIYSYTIRLGVSNFLFNKKNKIIFISKRFCIDVFINKKITINALK